MPRLRAKHLQHRVDIRRIVGEGSEGPLFSNWEPDVPAYVEQKARKIIDRRSTSPTADTEIISETFVVLLTVNDVLPGSEVRVWKGTPRERTSEVATSALFDYRRTPSHVEAYLV
ncbi:hypothetical protein BH09ACT9_BH09ACT9_00690 [soil metagenome]